MVNTETTEADHVTVLRTHVNGTMKMAEPSKRDRETGRRNYQRRRLNRIYCEHTADWHFFSKQMHHILQTTYCDVYATNKTGSSSDY
jgi:hypothetical protein